MTVNPASRQSAGISTPNDDGDANCLSSILAYLNVLGSKIDSIERRMAEWGDPVMAQCVKCTSTPVMSRQQDQNDHNLATTTDGDGEASDFPVKLPSMCIGSTLSTPAATSTSSADDVLHVRNLKSLPTMSQIKSLSDFSSKVHAAVGALIVAGNEKELKSRRLLQKVVSKMSMHLKRRWRSRDAANSRKGDLKQFDSWLQRQARTAIHAERCKTTIDSATHQGKDNLSNSFVVQMPTAPKQMAAPASKSKTAKKKIVYPCFACKANPPHAIDSCTRFLRASYVTRLELACINRRCPRCLEFHHGVRCTHRVKCGVVDCGRHHHTLLHPPGKKAHPAPSGERISTIARCNVTRFVPVISSRQVHQESVEEKRLHLRGLQVPKNDTGETACAPSRKSCRVRRIGREGDHRQSGMNHHGLMQSQPGAPKCEDEPPVKINLSVKPVSSREEDKLKLQGSFCEPASGSLHPATFKSGEGSTVKVTTSSVKREDLGARHPTGCSVLPAASDAETFIASEHLFRHLASIRLHASDEGSWGKAPLSVFQTLSRTASQESQGGPESYAPPDSLQEELRNPTGDRRCPHWSSTTSEVLKNMFHHRIANTLS